MIFKTMKKEDVVKALEGHTDILTEAIKRHEDYFRRLSCVSCGGDVIAVVNPHKLFRENEVLPNYLAKCKACGCEFEPYTKILVKS
jgi:hypothetical protein